MFELGSGFIKFGGKDAGLGQMIDANIMKLDKFKSVADEVGRIGRRAFLVLAGSATGSAIAFANFEQAMARVRGVVSDIGNQGGEFEALQRQALTLGATTVFTALEAAKAQGILGVASFKTADILAAMPSVLALASSAQLDVAQAADIMANAIKGMQLPASDAANVADALVVGFTNAKTELNELGEAFNKVGPDARNANISLNETAAILATMAEGGKRGTEAGTGLRRILAKLSITEGASPKILDSLGIERIEKATGALRPMADIVDDINNMLQGKGPAARTAFTNQVFGDRGGPAFLALLNQGGEAIRNFTRMMDESGGAAKRLQMIQEDTLTGSFKLLTSAISGAAIAFGTELNPIIRPIVDGLTQLVGIVEDIVRIAPNLVVGTGAFLTVVAGLAASLPLVVGAVRLMLLALGPMGIKFALVAGPVAVLIAALAKLALHFELVSFSGESMAAKVATAFAFLEDVVTNVGSAIDLAMLKIIDALTFSSSAGIGARIQELEEEIAKRLADNELSRRGGADGIFDVSEKLRQIQQTAGGLSSQGAQSTIVPKFIDAAEAWKRVSEQLLGENKEDAKNRAIQNQTNAQNNATKKTAMLIKSNQNLQDAINKNTQARSRFG